MPGSCSPRGQSRKTRPACRLTVNGEAKQGALYQNANADAIEQTPLKITNNGDGALQAVVSVTGAPMVPEPEIEKGFKIERLYYTLSGEPADISKVKQNQRFAVVLKITEHAAAIRAHHRR